MTYPIVPLPDLPPNTIIPENEDLFVSYFNDLYNDIALAVNYRDFDYYPMAISDTPQNIINLPNFGAFLICVCGEDADRDSSGNPIGWLPTLNDSLCKSDATAAGSIAVLGSQVGTGTWAGFALTITSTATNFQISHNNTGIIGNFNIRLIRTQG